MTLLAAWAGPVLAAAPPLRLEVPVDCAVGPECVVQNYLDHDPGPGASDQTCGPLTYDGHRGTDFRIPGVREMAAGVAVVAAAPGLVRRARDGVADVRFRESGAEAMRGREAGNAVVLDHGDGWETQYSHLRRGSVAVKPGQRVAAGTRLGLIGLSGKTEFPHLHFAVRHDGRTVDPYTGRPPEGGCAEAGRLPGLSLWSAAARAALAYRAGGLLQTGFAAGPVTLEGVLGGADPAPPVALDSPALVFWAAAWGLRAGDRETIRLTGPGGAVLAESEAVLSGHKAQSLRYAGRRRGSASWPPGTYRGDYRATRVRDGRATAVVEVTREIELR